MGASGGLGTLTIISVVCVNTRFCASNICESKFDSKNVIEKD
jgi:hypothetical protein